MEDRKDEGSTRDLICLVTSEGGGFLDFPSKREESGGPRDGEINHQEDVREREKARIDRSKKIGVTRDFSLNAYE